MPNSIVRKLRLRKEKPREITAFLGKEDIETNFSCNYCKNTLFKHKQRIVAVLVGHSVKMLSCPISIQCKSCGTIYHIKNIL